MCSLLPDEQFRRAERVALANADASLLTVGEACALLGIEPSADDRRVAVLGVEPLGAGGRG